MKCISPEECVRGHMYINDTVLCSTNFSFPHYKSKIQYSQLISLLHTPSLFLNLQVLPLVVYKIFLFFFSCSAEECSSLESSARLVKVSCCCCCCCWHLPVSTMLLCVEERGCYGNDWRRVGWELACPVLLH